jgi:hypothetical protein
VKEANQTTQTSNNWSALQKRVGIAESISMLHRLAIQLGRLDENLFNGVSTLEARFNSLSC